MREQESSRFLPPYDSAKSTCLEMFEAALNRDPGTTIETFLNARPQSERAELPAVVAFDLSFRLRRNPGVSVEDYFQRFPELQTDREVALDLIFTEYCERLRFDPATSPEQYYTRFPHFRESLVRLFSIDSALTPVGDHLPVAGDTFLDFRLITELGRGSFGRVFLAQQASLSYRHVVVKITPIRAVEPQMLARLDHPNIVPIYSVQKDDNKGLQAVCMPHQNAVSLADVHTKWQSEGFVPRMADDLISAVTDLLDTEGRRPENNGVDASFPLGKDIVFLCCWMMRQLSGALHHAHIRGICHLDLKPSNILVTAGGRPLLVDFNLAFDQLASGPEPHSHLGGTLPYMSPEQLNVLLQGSKKVLDSVGPKSDVFSLAATFFELLTGQFPFELQKPTDGQRTFLQAQLDSRFSIKPRAMKLNRAVPKDLDALLAKCLTPESGNRYETALQLTEDLTRFLQDLPLQWIGRISGYSRFHKFVRRNRKPLALFSAGFVGSAVVVAALHFSEQHRIAKARAERTSQVDRMAREDAEQIAVNERVARLRVQFELAEAQEDAIKEVERAFERIPKNGQEYFNRGYLYFSAGRLHHAIHAFTLAIESGFDRAEAYYFRARSYALLDRDPEALQDLDKTIELRPDFEFGYLNRGLFYATSRTHKDPSKAIQDIEMTIRLMPSTFRDRAMLFNYDIARAFTALASDLSIERIDERQQLMSRAEEFLAKSVEMGLSVQLMRELNAADPYKLLDPVFSSKAMLEALERMEKELAAP